MRPDPSEPPEDYLERLFNWFGPAIFVIVLISGIGEWLLGS